MPDEGRLGSVELAEKSFQEFRAILVKFGNDLSKVRDNYDLNTPEGVKGFVGEVRKLDVGDNGGRTNSPGDANINLFKVDTWPRSISQDEQFRRRRELYLNNPYLGLGVFILENGTWALEYAGRKLRKRQDYVPELTIRHLDEDDWKAVAVDVAGFWGKGGKIIEGYVRQMAREDKSGLFKKVLKEEGVDVTILS